MPQVFIGIGSNISPEQNIRAALQLLSGAVDVIDMSIFYRTEALHRPEEAPFINGVVKALTEADPFILKFHILRRVEKTLGRVRTGDPYAPRAVDLDILVYDNLAINTEGLVLPDPEIEKRAFLAIPLCQLDPMLILPGGGRNICRIARELEGAEMEPLPLFTEELRRTVRRSRAA